MRAGACLRLAAVMMAGLALGSTVIPGAAVGTASPDSADSLPWPPDPPAAPALARAAAIAAAGRALFFDPSLSASGRMACATCHDPAHGFSPPNAQPVQMGGARLDQPGTRAAPGLTYLTFRPVFTEHFHESDDEGDESIDAGPTGGLTWDGRFNRVRDQASIPLLSANEMANASPAAVVAKVRDAAYASDLRAIHGADVFDDDARAFAAVTEALEAYLETPSEFAPFTSKYDAYLRGQVSLASDERRGLEAFTDTARGNCAQCHRSGITRTGNLPLFTDFGILSAGVPRNPAIPANADPNYYDLGLCGPLRTDLSDMPEYCGLFMTPTLRNVALKQSFFHNGFAHSLRDAVAFYAERETSPAKWFSRNADGTVRKYDDLPPQYQGNVNLEAPFNRQIGDPPALTAQEIDDIVSFLKTLTDGYVPPPGSAPVSASAAK